LNCFWEFWQLKIPKITLLVVLPINKKFTFATKRGLEICMFPLLLCNQSNHHPQEDLAKFGYSPYMTKKKRKNPFMFWVPNVKIR
jgi:hypothetical protein